MGLLKNHNPHVLDKLKTTDRKKKRARKSAELISNALNGDDVKALVNSVGNIINELQQKNK